MLTARQTDQILLFMMMRDIRKFDTLILPGWHNSEPGHWQSEWQSAFPNMVRVEQADWETPSYSVWAANLSEAAARCRRPILMIAHSLGTALVTRWAQDGDSQQVVGAFLVAPSDRDRLTSNQGLPSEALRR